MWDTATGELRDTLRGHSARLHGLVFAADGRTVYSVSQDGSLIAWDAAGDRSFAIRRSRTPALRTPPSTSTNALNTITQPLVTWSDDGRRVYVAAGDGSAAALIDIASGRRVSSLPAVAIDPFAETPAADLDQQAIFTTTTNGLLRRHDLRTGETTRTVTVDAPLMSHTIAVSGDGRLLAAELESQDAAGNWQVRGIDLRDTQTLALRRRLPPLSFIPWYIWLNRDGALLAAAEFSGNHVELWDTTTGRRHWRTDLGHRSGSAIALAPDGRTMAVGTFEGAVLLLDVATGRILTRHTERLSSRITSTEFSPDGQTIAIGGNDGHARLLTADTLREIGPLPAATGATWVFISHDPDGSTLSAVDERGHIVQWNTRPASWIARACQIVSRDFTTAEWDSYLPGLPQQRTCATG